MTEALPLALAIAASPVPVIPVLLLLLTPRALATAGSFLLGWAAGVGAVTAVAALVAEAVESSQESATWASWARIVLGVALVGYGVRQWVTRSDASGELPGWMRSVQDASPAAALRLGLLLSAANPKILLMAAAGGLAIGGSGLTGTAEALAVVGFTLVGSLSVGVPVLLYALLGGRVLGPLGRARDWLELHHGAVMAVVLVVIGLALTAKGIRGL